MFFAVTKADDNLEVVVDTIARVEKWNTWTDESTRLSLSDPATWAIVKTTYAEVGFRPATITPENHEWSAIYLYFRENNDNLEFEDYYEQAIGVQNLFEANSPIKDRKVGSYNAKYFPVIPGAVVNSVLAFRKGMYVVETQVHLD